MVAAEKSMLEDHGHEVSLLEADNAEISGALTQVNSGTITVLGPATKVRVETAADGSGSVVPAQSVTAGSSVTGYRIAPKTSPPALRS